MLTSRRVAFAQRRILWLAGAAALFQLACTRPLVLQGRVDVWESPPPGSKSFMLIDSDAPRQPMRLHALAGARIRASRMTDFEAVSGADGTFTLTAQGGGFYREWLFEVEADGCESARGATRQRFATSYPLSAVLVCER